MTDLSNTQKILYTLTVVANIWGRLFAGMMRVPVVVSGYRNLMSKQHDRLLWRFNDGIITNCEACRSVLTGRHRVNPARIFVVPNGVDSEHFTPRNGGKSPSPSVVYAGRLVEEWEAK